MCHAPVQAHSVVCRVRDCEDLRKHPVVWGVTFGLTDLLQLFSIIKDPAIKSLAPSYPWYSVTPYPWAHTYGVLLCLRGMKLLTLASARVHVSKFGSVDSYRAHGEPQLPVQCGEHSMLKYSPLVLFHTLPGKEHGSPLNEAFDGPLIHSNLRSTS